MKKFPYQHISVLILPTDYCNMNCVYCFNSRKTNSSCRKMEIETVKKIFSTVIPYYKEINFIWHGGEPMAMGKAFYEEALKLQKEINVNNAKIENSIQSNLTLLDEELADFFIDNKFEFGSSFDGTQNELTRHCSKKILAGRDILVGKGKKTGFICVVQSKNVDYLIEDYEWFKSQNINYTINQYLTSSPYEEDDLFVPAEYYISKVCELFDYWAKDSACNINISYFDELVDYILFKKKKLCCYNSCLGKYIGIQHDGTIYVCNRDFPNNYCLGNIFDYNDIRECFGSNGFNLILKDAVIRRNKCKNNCTIYDFCEGGCNSVALAGGSVAKSNSYFCKTLSSIYKHVENNLMYWIEYGENFLPTNLNPSLSKRIIKYKEIV